jgi:6-phosphogluconolactonase
MAEVIRTENFVEDAAERIASRIRRVQEGDRRFRLSLCGGGTPRPVYEALAQCKDVDWQRVIVTFGDERCVGPKDEASNYRMARESLLKPARVPEENVVRIEGEREPEDAARVCELRLRDMAKATGDLIFEHDLVLLGMGDDGHTASLFPGTAALEENERWVISNYVPKFESSRVTFTFPLIQAAEEVMFLVTGEAKLPVVGEAVVGIGGHPAGSVKPDSGKVTWLLG